MIDLKTCGLTDRFAAFAAQYPQYSIARITAQEKGLYRLVSENGEQSAEVSGKFRFSATTVSDFPAVGDFVMADLNEGNNAIIQAVLPRKSVFLRKAAGTAKTEQVVAANIDVLFLCMALNNDFNLRRMERYLSIAWESGAMPVVVLTKADLCDSLAEKTVAVEGIAVGTDVIVTSSMEKDGVEKVRPYLTENRTIALIGSSGVGKSTLINRLLGEERIATNGLRNDDKGRHTTTHRELIVLPNGGVVIDTPGMRELGVWDAEEGISTAFADIEQLTLQCKFKDCSHTREPGCAIREALKNGSITQERYASYCMLLRENEFSADSRAYIAAKSKKFKAIAKINKDFKKR